ncbi:GNAT family N-acetyltransferase [Geodermatophilaceae bacterium NBWT11]|nr:GNAT family N-acetyltransferase [Geodermatophilaceae bacterium NBWT11]
MGQRRSPLDVVELEHLAARGWRGAEVQPLGDWLLRAGGGGFTKRAHSVLVVGDPGRPLTDAVPAVVDWYADRGLTPCAQLPGRQSRAADAALAAAGWERDADTLVLTAPLEDDGTDDRVLLDVAPDAAWLATARLNGAPLPDAALDVLTGADRVRFASVRSPDGDVLAVARGVLVGDWLGVTAVEVAASARRRGLGGAVTRTLQGWAFGEGARWCYLQVTEANAPARALYRRLGLIEHHRYHYRWAPAG